MQCGHGASRRVHLQQFAIASVLVHKLRKVLTRPFSAYVFGMRLTVMAVPPNETVIADRLSVIWHELHSRSVEIPI